MPPVAVKPSRPRDEIREASLPSFEHFRAGLNVEQVAERMGRALSTVRGYLADFIRHEKITDPSEWVDAATAERIAAAVEEVGDERLRPIFQRLNEEVDYDKIRIVVGCLANREALQEQGG